MRDDSVGKEIEIWGKAVSHILHACPLELPGSPRSAHTSTLNGVGRDHKGLTGEFAVQAEKRERGVGGDWSFTVLELLYSTVLSFPSALCMASQDRGRGGRGGEDRWGGSALVHLQLWRGERWRGTSWHDRLEQVLLSPSWRHPIAWIAACFSFRTCSQPPGKSRGSKQRSTFIFSQRFLHWRQPSRYHQEHK